MSDSGVNDDDSSQIKLIQPIDIQTEFKKEPDDQEDASKQGQADADRQRLEMQDFSVKANHMSSSNWIV